MPSGCTIGAILVHLFGPQKQEKPPLSAFRRGFWIWNCGDSRIRTGDPMLAKHVLYQLSYTPKRKKPVWWAGLVGTGRVELPTSTLSVWRSNQLS